MALVGAARQLVLRTQPVLIFSSAAHGNACQICRTSPLLRSRRVVGCSPLMSGRSSGNYNRSPAGFGHRPSKLDRWILVWTKAYPALADVPEFVTISKMMRARDRFRVHVNICMILGALVGIVFMIRSGRKMASEGDTLHKRNMLWHKRNKEAHEAKIKAEQEAAASKS